MAFRVRQTRSDGTVKKTLPTSHGEKEAAVRSADRLYRNQGFGVDVVDDETDEVVYARRKDNDYLGVA